MAAGVKVWDAAGNLIVDITSRLSRVAGTRAIGATEVGNFIIPTGYGQIWVHPLSADVHGYTPHLDVSQETGQIIFGPDFTYPGGPRPVTLIYGYR
ncbi:MAG TPA: hypothetical protein VD865_14725 [Stenotrophomonas sp.]|nr:hypothetical protein [Stenotrophomonas sp.]